MTPSATRRVSIVQEWLATYRVSFFDDLRERLERQNVHLDLVHGDPPPPVASRGQSVELSWAKKVGSVHVPIGRREIVLQAIWPIVRSADLVVLEAAVRHLMSDLLLALPRATTPRRALWGHAPEEVSSGLGKLRATKRLLARRADWWFAYTEPEASRIRRLPFPGDQITVVNNSIDTRATIRHRDELTEDDLGSAAQEVGLVGRNVCVFDGSLYREKRIDFLLEAAVEVRRYVADFELVFIGSGPEGHRVDAAQAVHPWIHQVGARFGQSKAALYSLSRLVLCPAALGLVVLDAFCHRTPIVTVAGTGHGPEWSYLVPGTNSIVCRSASTPQDYARVVTRLLEDDIARNRLVRGCDASAQRYSVEDMSRRFTEGLLQALDHA